MSDKDKPTGGTGLGRVALREVRWVGEPVKPVVSTVQDDRPPPVKIGKVTGTIPEQVTPVKGGTGEGGRPAPIGTTLKTLHDDIKMLHHDIKTLHDDIATLRSEGAQLKSALAALTAALNTHHHTYTGGVDYWNTGIHGHPAWDVETKLVSVITASMAFSNNWETSTPKFPGT